MIIDRRMLAAMPAARGLERGATLLISLIMLVLLTLFVVSAINISNTNMKIVGNVASRKSAENTAQLAIEQVLNSMTAFSSPSAAVTVTAPTGMTATVGNRVCLRADAASGYSAAVALAPEDTYRDVPVTVTDSIAGTKTVMHQGVKIRMLAGKCPS